MKEHRIEPETLQNGSVWDLVLSEDRAQRYIFVADGANNQMLVVERDSGKVLSRFSRPGRMAGELKWVHNMADRLEGQPLHRGSRHRAAHAEICARAVAAVVRVQ